MVMDKIIDDIAKNIKKYRKFNGMTQKDLAAKVGVSIAAVSNWETGTNSIDIDSLFKVCDALGVPISVMTSSDDDFEISPTEREMIRIFRGYSPLNKFMICRMMGAPLPPECKKYAEIFDDDIELLPKPKAMGDLEV